MNNVSITGRIVHTPETRTTANGVAVCSFALAVKRPRAKDTTDFIECVAWKQSAEYMAKYGSKGDLVCATGSITTRKWEDKNGNKRTAVEVTCDNVELIGGKKSSEGKAASASNSYTAPAQAKEQQPFPPEADFSVLDDDADLPFN